MRWVRSSLGVLMTTSTPLPPSVVAVVVSREGSNHARAALASLAAQDYDDLSILFLTANGDQSVAAMVAAACPGAYVRVVEDRVGYAAVTNLALEMVDGASYFLCCHDDVELAPSAVRMLVETALRENAGIVTPKVVDAEHHRLLLHVGQNADKTGAISERVTPGELDAGQHDAVRDVFVAPSGVTLIRADLFAALEGYDVSISAMGEDLELSWRAQVVGSRVVLAPLAVVAHRRICAGGFAEASTPEVQQRLQRRHEVRAMLVNSSGWTLALWLPIALLLAVVEWLVATAGRDSARADAVRGAWGWNFSQRSSLRARRSVVAAKRTIHDRDLHDRMVPGSTRAKVFMSRLFYQGLTVARGGGVVVEDDNSLTATIGEAFSENQEFDDLDDLGHGSDRGGARRFLGTRSGRAVAYGLAIVAYLLTARGLLTGGLSYLGQFAPWPSWTGALHDVLTVWHPTGIGSTVAAPSGFGAMALAGVFTFGHMGLAELLVVIVALPIGAVGVGRLVTPLVSERARLVAVLAYGILPLFASAVSIGRLDAVVAVAAMPWLMVGLGRLGGVAHLERPSTTAALGSAGWISTPSGRFVALSVLLAITASIAPALVVDVVVVAMAFVVGGLIFGRSTSFAMLRTALLACVAAAVLCFPWVIDLVAHPSSLLASLGTSFSPTSAPSMGHLLTFAVGIQGTSWWSWALLVGAGLPILVVRGERLVLATQLTLVAVGSWVLAAMSAWHLLGTFAPRPEVVLAPAAVAVAALVGLALSGFEVELSDFAFSWRQVVTVTGLAVAMCSVLTVVVELPSGRFNLGTVGLDQSLAGVEASFSHGGGRVLWIGDPRVLPVAGWSIEPGLSYATTTSTVASAWSILPAGAALSMHAPAAIDAVLHGTTATAGALFAEDAITTIVVVGSAAPSIANPTVLSPDPAPSALVAGLRLQDDLAEQSDSGGLDVFTVNGARPIVALASQPSRAALGALRDGLGAPGPIEGAITVSGAPASAITASGVTAPRTVRSPSSVAFVGNGSVAHLAISVVPVVSIEALLEYALWILVALALLGRLTPTVRSVGRFRRLGRGRVPAVEPEEAA